MSEGLAVFILMNNYFHDIATAMFLASGVAMWVIIKNLGNNKEEATAKYFTDVSRKVTMLARFSIYGLLISSILRMLAFKKFEWENAVEAHHVSYLLARHIIAFIAACSGIYLWVKLTKRIREIKGQTKTA